jgi:hypothetical protein
MNRPVISNDGWKHIESDIWGVQEYTSLPAELANRYGGDVVQYLKSAEGWSV